MPVKLKAYEYSAVYFYYTVARAVPSTTVRSVDQRPYGL